MGGRGGSLVAALACSLLGCTPHESAQASREVPAETEAPSPPPAEAPVPVEAPPAPVAERVRPDPPDVAEVPPEPPALEQPTVAAGDRVVVTVESSVEDDGEEGCMGFGSASNVPAYDPVAQEVLALETYARKMSTEREAELVWYDATTGAETRREDLLVVIPASGCARANRRARRRARALTKELSKRSWEAMTPVAIRRVHEDSYLNLRGELEDAADEESREAAAAFAESLMPRGQVHVVARNTGTIVRLPGIQVYERDVDIHPNTLAELVAHPSGVVAATHANCRDEEDCTCNLEDAVSVMRWSPATLAAIEAHPCELVEADDYDEFACALGSIYDG